LAGQFIDRYMGEIITKEEGIDRLEAGAKGKTFYLFTPENFQATIERMYEIDREYVGGPTRFMNHSCEPNCAVHAVSYNKHNSYLYDLAFFALRYIAPGEELTF